MNPEEAQLRVVLVGHLFKEGVRALAADASPRPAEKERLLAAVEHAVWDLPASVFLADDPAWPAPALEDPRVRAAFDAAVAQARERVS